MDIKKIMDLNVKGNIIIRNILIINKDMNNDFKQDLCHK